MTTINDVLENLKRAMIANAQYAIANEISMKSDVKLWALNARLPKTRALKCKPHSSSLFLKSVTSAEREPGADARTREKAIKDQDVCHRLENLRVINISQVIGDFDNSLSDIEKKLLDQAIQVCLDLEEFREIASIKKQLVVAIQNTNYPEELPRYWSTDHTKTCIRDSLCAFFVSFMSIGFIVAGAAVTLPHTALIIGVVMGGIFLASMAYAWAASWYASYQQGQQDRMVDKSRQALIGLVSSAQEPTIEDASCEEGREELSVHSPGV